MPSILQGGAKPMPMKPEGGGAPMPMRGGEGGPVRSTLVSHGPQGPHQIEHEDGNVTEHPHIGHALMAMAGKHSDGLHHHTHSDGMGGGHTVHKSEHGGDAEGPEEHDNLDSVKAGMDDFFKEGDGEESGERDEAGKKEGKSGGSDGKDWE